MLHHSERSGPFLEAQFAKHVLQAAFQRNFFTACWQNARPLSSYRGYLFIKFVAQPIPPLRLLHLPYAAALQSVFAFCLRLCAVHRNETKNNKKQASSATKNNKNTTENATAHFEPSFAAKSAAKNNRRNSPASLSTIGAQCPQSQSGDQPPNPKRVPLACTRTRDQTCSGPAADSKILTFTRLVRGPAADTRNYHNGFVTFFGVQPPTYCNCQGIGFRISWI
jgi:hypothetical protein